VPLLLERRLKRTAVQIGSLFLPDRNGFWAACGGGDRSIRARVLRRMQGPVSAVTAQRSG